MSLLLRSQLRFLWQVRGSVASALLGISLGVASVVGVHLLSGRIAEGVDAQLEPVGALDIFLLRDRLTEADYFRLRRQWRAGNLPGVAALVPLVEGRLNYGGAPSGSRVLRVVGTDPLAFPQPSNSSGAIGEGQWHKYLTTDSIMLASEFGVAAGSLIELGPLQVRVLGDSGLRGVALADIATAQALLGRGGELTRIGVRLSQASGRTAFGYLRVWLGKLLPGALRKQAPPPLRALDALAPGWRQISVAAANPVLQLTQSVLFNIAALSLLSLIVAWLLTYQVAQHALERRAAMLQRLLSVGVPKRRLTRMILFEGVAIGALAALFGALLGAYVAAGLFALILGEAPQPPLVLDAWGLGKAIFSGLGVGALSYYLAFVTGTASGRKPRSRGPALLVVLAFAFAWGLLDQRTGLVGAFVCIGASCALLIGYLPNTLQWVWRYSSKAKRAPLRLLPLRQLLAGPELRLGISALTLAIATALGIGTMVDSFRAAFVELLDARLVDDVVVELAPRSTRADAAAIATLVAPFADDLLWRGSIGVTLAGVPGRVEYASDNPELLRRFAPSSAPLAPNETLLSEGFARLNGIAAGNEIELTGALGSRKMRIAALFRDYGAMQPRLLMSRAAAAHLGDVSFVQELGLSSTATVELKAQLNQRGIAYTDNAVVRSNLIKIFEQTFGITRALTLLALLVATLALANALAAHNLQMRPTDRLLEALGLDAAGARSLRIWRASLAGGLAIVLALPLGLLMAWLLTNLVNPRAFGWQFPLRFTLPGIGWPIVGGLVAVVLSMVRIR